MPYNALGSSVVLDCIVKDIPVYAILENKTVLNIDKTSINKTIAIKEIATYDDYINIIKEIEYEKS